MLKFLRRVFFRAVEAEKVKERVRKSVVYEEEVVDMSDASLNVADRKELYDFFVQAKVKKGKLITRSETLDELRQFSGGLVGGCFEEVEMKYSGRLRLLSARVVKLLEGVRKGVVFGEKSLLIISFGQHLYFPFRFIAIQLVKVGSYCVNLDIKSSKLLKLLCFDDFCSKEKFPNNRSTDDFFQYLSRLHYGELTIVTILMLMFCYLIEFVRVNKLRVIHNIPIFSDLQKRLGEGFKAVYNGAITDDVRKSSGELADEILKFYERKLKFSDLHYEQIMQKFAEHLSGLDLTQVNLRAVHLILKERDADFKGLKNIFSQDFVAFYEMVRPQNLRNFKNLMNGDPEFAKAVWTASKLNGAVLGLLRAKNLDGQVRESGNLSLEDVNDDLKMADLVKKDAPLSKKEMRSMLGKIVFFGGRDFEELQEQPLQRSQGAKQNWRNFVEGCRGGFGAVSLS